MGACVLHVKKEGRARKFSLEVLASKTERRLLLCREQNTKRAYVIPCTINRACVGKSTAAAKASATRGSASWANNCLAQPGLISIEGKDFAVVAP